MPGSAAYSPLSPRRTSSSWHRNSAFVPRDLRCSPSAANAREESCCRRRSWAHSDNGVGSTKNSSESSESTWLNIVSSNRSAPRTKHSASQRRCSGRDRGVGNREICCLTRLVDRSCCARIFRYGLPSAPYFNSTGCVNAPFPAESHAANRTHFFPAASNGIRYW